MAHQVAPRAIADLDDIWLYVAQESASIDIADRLIDTITSRFYMLSDFPHAGRMRDHEFGIGMRSFPISEFLIVYLVEGNDVLILRIVHGRRELEAIFNL